MVANQIYALINAVASESLGGTAITVKDTSTLVSLGNAVLSSSTSVDNFYSKLVDRIGRTYIKFRKYTTETRKGMMMMPLDFGIVLQKIQSGDLAEAVENESWWQNDTQADPFDVENDSTDFTSKLFSKLAVFETTPKVIYDHQLKTAFTNEQTMGAFVNMIYNDMHNAMELAIENTSKLCRATGIVSAYKSTNTSVKRNILAEYNLIATTPITSADVLTDEGFLRFFAMEVSKVIKKFPKMNKLYSPTKATRFVPTENITVDILADVSSALDSYLYSTTFHKELVELPNYNELDSWQGLGTSGSLADISKVNIKREGDNAGTEVNGVLAIVRDEDACGMMVDRIRTHSIYNPRSECTNVFHKADIGYFYDESEPFVIFYVEDTEDNVES